MNGIIVEYLTKFLVKLEVNLKTCD